MTFENAIEQNFKCAECGTIMQEQDNSRTKEFLTERIVELEHQVKAATLTRKVAMEAEPKAVKAKAPKKAVKAKVKIAVKVPAKKRK